jgi:predicted nuclease of predicted toxin-antitoxin system
VRFKLDENLSRSVATLFRGAGHDVMTVREEQLHGAPDEEVFDTSVREGRALVTLDRSLWIVEPGRLRIHLTNDDE